MTSSEDSGRPPVRPRPPAPPVPPEPADWFVDDQNVPDALDSAPAMVSFDTGPQIRDRIVVLGRRRAGKTIYLARLYEAAWNGQFRDLHMRAIPGPGNGHERFMETVASLRDGRWPEATAGSTSTPIDVEYRGERHLLVALDYPGEVFRRAFVQGSDEEAAIELRDHVDRAAGVVLLLDPDVAVAGTMTETVDDDYGMSEAIRRIREQPGGTAVPIAIVLTKCDVHAGLVKEVGGLRAFTERYYHNILRVAKGTSRRFAAAAVRVRQDARGTQLPTLQHEPANIVEPMLYCIDKMIKSRQTEVAAEATRNRNEQSQQYAEAALEDARRRSVRTALVVGLVVIALGVLVAINYFIFLAE